MGPCLCGDTECPWCGPMQGGPTVDYADPDEPWTPDPETPWNCDICGCVLPRGHKNVLCDECDTELRLLKLGKEWKYPYSRED